MKRDHWMRRSISGLVVLLAFAISTIDSRAQDVPPAILQAAEGAAAPAPATTEMKDAKGDLVATPAGEIRDDRPVDDKKIVKILEEFLPIYPGVRKIEVSSRDGLVVLKGHIENKEISREVTEIAGRVEGVRLVINSMKTDDEILTGDQIAWKVIKEYLAVVRRKWLLAIVAIGVFAAAIFLARKCNDNSERLLAPVFKNLLLRSVVGSLLGTAIAFGGAMLALSILDLTHIVLSIMGVAGLATLAVGFAFRDIVENFIASILLGVRRPFQIGDYVQVAGHSGVIKSLNSRATVLVTLEGNQVRIPNATIYKEILVNFTASSSVRGSFDVVIPHDVSIDRAQTAIGKALAGHDGILDEPAPRTLVEALERDGVRLRAYYWYPARDVDRFKILSDCKLRTKVELQRAGIEIGADPTEIAITQPVRMISAASIHANEDQSDRDRSGQERENLRRDSIAAKHASAVIKHGTETPLDQLLDDAESNGRRDEGQNLIDDSRRTDDDRPLVEGL